MKRWSMVVGLVMAAAVLGPALAMAGTREVTVTGRVNEPDATVRVNGVTATVQSTGDYFAAITLNEGSNTITVTATDAMGNAGQATVTVSLDTIGPAVSIVSPTDGQLFGAE